LFESLPETGKWPDLKVIWMRHRMRYQMYHPLLGTSLKIKLVRKRKQSRLLQSMEKQKLLLVQQYCLHVWFLVVLRVT